jgi:DNA-binding CsgD family transcriptional regulator
MDTDRIAKLTEKQRICLRLVYMHRSSKEIARELGIGSDAVDQRLKTAMRTLGVESRVEASRLLAAHEGVQPYQRLVYQSPDVVSPGIPSMFASATGEGVRTGTKAGGAAVREEQASFETLGWQSTSGLPFALPLARGRRNGLEPWQKLAWIVAIAIGTAIGFGAFLTGLQALAQLTRLAP